MTIKTRIRYLEKRKKLGTSGLLVLFYDPERPDIYYRKDDPDKTPLSEADVQVLKQKLAGDSEDTIIIYFPYIKT